jgi:5-hydroxyisourate hydrolase
MITTHILDTALGKPARDVSVKLERLDGAVFTLLGSGKTDADGRNKTLLPDGERKVGVYRITFDTAGYYAGAPCFFPSVSILFEVTDAASHHHVPLLLSPFGYSTYRGS